MHVHFLLIFDSSWSVGFGDWPDIMGASWLLDVGRVWTRRRLIFTTKVSIRKAPLSHVKIVRALLDSSLEIPGNNKSAVDELTPVSCNPMRLCPVTRQVTICCMHATHILAEVRKA